jgi:hypothetical protein
MNKFFFSLLLCGIATVAANAYGEGHQRPDVLLNTGEKISAEFFDLHNPIIKKLCEKNPSMMLACHAFVDYAELFQSRLQAVKTEEERKAALNELREYGMTDEQIRKNIEFAALIRASFEDTPKGIAYHDPIKPVSATSAQAATK